MLSAYVSALACVCRQQTLVTDEDFRKAVSDELNNATIVFEGRFIGMENVPITARINSKDDVKAEAEVLKFAVDYWWKGNSLNEVVLYTSIIKYPDGGVRRSTCDYGFGIGMKYLVYAFGSIDTLETNQCTRTNTIENAQKDLKVLRTLRVKESNCEVPFYTSKEVSQMAKLITRPYPKTTEEYRKNYPIIRSGIKPSETVKFFRTQNSLCSFV
jgi:hypothetical protein